MNKENLISVSNEIFEKRKESLKVRDSVVNIGNDILKKKNELDSFLYHLNYIQV